jgi:hypothetical protein
MRHVWAGRGEELGRVVQYVVEAEERGETRDPTEKPPLPHRIIGGGGALLVLLWTRTFPVGH